MKATPMQTEARREPVADALALRPLSRALGAEIHAADLTFPLEGPAFERIRRALDEADGLLVLHDVQMTPGQHIELARRFGPIERHAAEGFAHPDHPEILVVSNIMKKGRPIGAIYAGQYWHSDMSYVSRPPMQSLLYALQLPGIGGDTMFANMYRAYEALSGPMKRFLGAVEAVHDYSHAYDTYFNRLKERPPLTPELRAKVPPVRHPVVRTHPVTGRKSLFVSPGFTTGFVGMPAEESGPILEFLFGHSVRPEFIYRHRWRMRDLVIWDNSCTLHLATADYDLSTPRRLHRVTVAGGVPR
ncbi:MAG: TauD/TfdA family dioxygenase [Betaproteobacteria bacterium]|nr:TauD/TfdA family dioxygenase [Betaproteobacteria bacterium]